jgi:glutamate synthase (NADPH/NADH) large chain
MINAETKNQGLYLPECEHDACGIGLIAQIKRKRSHQLVSDAILMLENMEHRGGCGAEPETGDGAGIMIELPFSLFEKEFEKNNMQLPDAGAFGVGMLFLPKPFWESGIALFQTLAEEMDFELVHQRSVPVDNRFVGPTARETEPLILQVFLQHKNDLEGEALERKLYVLKKYASKRIAEKYAEFYIASLSTSKIVYKGQLRTDQLKKYYLDLQNEDLQSAFAIIHSRFSTNTFPKWSLAQPFRYIAHNGEINTIRGNINKMKSKEALMESTLFTSEELDKLLPVCDTAWSDSANLDELIELLVMGGRSLPHAMMMLVPEAWQYNNQIGEKVKAF